MNRSPQILTTPGEIVPTGSDASRSHFDGADETRPNSILSGNSRDNAAFPITTWQESMRAAVRSTQELRRLVGLTGDEPQTCESDFPTFVSREFISRMQYGDATDPLLRQVLPLADEAIEVSGFASDPVGDTAATVQPGLIQKYAGRALVIASGACGIHCRYCFRREFDYSSSGKGAWDQLLSSVRQRVDVDEVILSGGDPLTLGDDKLFRLLETIESIASVRRLRIHSRMPIVIPSRVTEALVSRLRASRLATWMVVHCNHANEIDAEVEAALGRLIDAGVPVLNQAVLLKGVNDTADALETLCRRLIDLRVQPYYLHQLDRTRGTSHFEVPDSVGLALIEAIRKRLPGYAVPQYVREIAGEPSKTPLTGASRG